MSSTSSLDLVFISIVSELASFVFPFLFYAALRDPEHKRGHNLKASQAVREVLCPTYGLTLHEK